MKKKIKTIFLFSLLLILFVYSTEAFVSTETNVEHIIKQEDQTSSYRINLNFNLTRYYIFVNGEIVDFSIQCLEWGLDLGNNTKGLIIELIDDSNSNIIISWLVQLGDNNEHHFTTDETFIGILQIVFYSMNVESTVFDFTITDKFPLWTYDAQFSFIQEGAFIIERYEEYIDYLDKIVLLLFVNQKEMNSFTVEIYDELNEIIGTYSQNYTLGETILVEIEKDGGFFTDSWFKIKFNFHNLDNQSYILCKLYYDCFQDENICRIFLNTGAMNLNQVPVDSTHDSIDFLWSVEDDGLPTPYYPPDIDFLIFIIKIVFFVVYGIAYGGASIWIIKRIIMKKRRRSRLIESQPSQKYLLQKNQPATYSPSKSYGINFAENIVNYKIETDEASKVSCSICLQIINNFSDLIRCPSCDMAFHKKHLYLWISSKGNCPSCKAQLRIK